MRRRRDYWRSFLDSLNSDGGHVFILVVLITMAVWMLKHDWSAVDGKSMLAAAMGALLMKFKVSGSNKDQTQDVTTVTAQTTTPAE
jgi:hypothetical protein